MAKKEVIEDAVVASLSLGDEVVSITVNAEGVYTFNSVATGPVPYEASGELLRYLNAVRNRETGQTAAVREFAPIAIDILSR